MLFRNLNLGRFLWTVLALLLLPGMAFADGRYFVETYTPYLSPAGELELESWVTSRSVENATAWDLRQEVEYGVSSRLTAAAYLNLSQPAGGSLQLEAPSLELIYALSKPGRIPGDPALYLETSASGDETELEPKLLLAHRTGRLMSALNLVGEFEFRHNDEELLQNGDVLQRQWAWKVAGGTAYEIASKFSAGAEFRYESEYANFGPRSGNALSLGPVLNAEAGKAHISVGMLRRLHGETAHGGDPDDLERTQLRAIVGFEL
ncbi:MAG: hypothetical protein ACM3PF_00425 [Bacteroidota bacterium]